MARRTHREMTMEEFEALQIAEERMETVQRMADEEGGATISFVPVPEKAKTIDAFDRVELPAPIVDAASGRHLAPVPFEPAPSRKSTGWTAERQRDFIHALAETGSVHLAARATGISARSAYRLRVRSQPFARAWTWRSSLLSAASPHSRSTARSTAARNSSSRTACSFPKSACRATAC